MDTVPDFSGENVQPRIIENYDGRRRCSRHKRPCAFSQKLPHLPSLKGKTLIVTDGTTVLGGDDKAGIAEIMTAIERVISENRPHGKLCIGFTPDEEVGSGADNFNVPNSVQTLRTPLTAARKAKSNTKTLMLRPQKSL